MKRPIFLTVWISLVLAFSVGITLYSFLYIPIIIFTKNYLNFVGILANVVQVVALIQILRWKKIGLVMLICAAIAGTIISAINMPTVVIDPQQVTTSILEVIGFNLIMIGVLYLAMRPVWQNYK